MQLEKRLTILALMCLGLGHRPAMSQDILFMPGDAFFHVSLTADVAKDFRSADGAVRVKYKSPLGLNGFGGSAGFLKLQIKNVPAKVGTEIASLYEKRRAGGYPRQLEITPLSDGTTQEREINGFHLLIYNQDFDLKRSFLGLRYNEQWFDTPQEARRPETGQLDLTGANSPMHVYQPFVRTYEAAIEDWRNAALVPGLKVIVPENVPWAVRRAALDSEVGAISKDLQYVVLDEQDLLGYFRRRPHHTLVSVTADRTKYYDWDKGKLVDVDDPFKE